MIDKAEGYLQKLIYLQSKKMDFGYYFFAQKIKRIALWGVNKQSLSLSELLRESSLVELAGIYDKLTAKSSCHEPYINYETDVCFVESFEIFLQMNELKIEAVILCDELQYGYGKYGIRIIHLDEFMREIGRYANTFFTQKWKTYYKKKNIKLHTVRIPRWYDLKIHNKDKIMTVEERLAWLSEENDIPLGTVEMDVFNFERRNACKNVIKKKDIPYFADYAGKYVKMQNQTRLIPNAPSDYKHRIILLGPCITATPWLKDELSIGYVLQEKLNRQNLPDKVLMVPLENAVDRYYYFELLEKFFSPKSGDTVFMIDQTDFMIDWDVDTIDIFKKLYSEYGDKFYYDHPVHVGAAGIRMITDLFMDIIIEQLPPQWTDAAA